MEKIRIYLCDLCHTAQGIVSEFAPYGIGCIKSYFYKYSVYSDKFDITLFKYPNNFIEKFKPDKPEIKKPQIIGFSNYVWNLDLSYSIAKKIKEQYKDILIIFGGPNYPLEDELQEKWLQNHSSVDLYITGEAEEPFTRVIDYWYETNSIEKVKVSNIDGCHSIVAGKLFKSGNATPRLDDLNMFPSPYTEGYLDEFINDKRIIPMIQTNRGCPFTCTFCEKGSKNWTKMTSISVSLFEKELEYIARKTKNKVLLLADSNFGMFKQDIQIAKILAKSKEINDYPYYIVGGTGKSENSRILECIEILRGSLPVTASVQSMDADVLANIKRKNISNDALLNRCKSAHKSESTTRSEIILALPGDTKEKHFNSVFKLVDTKMQFILSYTLILFDGSELATNESKKRWFMNTRFRANHRCFGSYPFGKDTIKSAEIEEVVVATDSLCFEDYLECRTFDLTTFIFLSDDMLYELLLFLELFNIKPSQLLMTIHEKKDLFFTPKLDQLYESFNLATRNELWDSREELEKYIKSLEPIRGDDKIVGYNVLFRHRAVALIELVDEIINTAFSVAVDLLDKNISEEFAPFLSEFRLFMTLKKRNVFDFDIIFNHSFNYNFSELIKNKFRNFSQRLEEPINLTFFHTNQQKKLFKGFNPGIEGVMRIIPRLSLAATYRTVKNSNNLPEEVI